MPHYHNLIIIFHSTFWQGLTIYIKYGMMVKRKNFMGKQHIKAILISMRTHENESKVNFLLGQIDMMSETDITEYLAKIGNSEENIKSFFEKELQSPSIQTNEEHTPINKMFTYGISEDSVHFHLPRDLHDVISSIGISKTFDTVNLHLLDAINRVKNLKDSGFHKLSNIDKIYMISPILFGKEAKFLKEMGFQVNSYKKGQLQNDEFVNGHSEARLATRIFGNEQNIATAFIPFKTLNTPEWQAKYKAKIKEFHEKGIFLEQNEKEK